ncbi:MAG: N-acetylmuramoyl-L-alanine amidase [Buchnera aphidicola (Meitanaphis flavogallis)]
MQYHCITIVFFIFLKNFFYKIYPKTKNFQFKHLISANSDINNKNYKKKTFHKKSFIQKYQKIKKIVIAIDAGHGGQDPGAIGINKTQEKNINLAISEKLKHKLNKSKLFQVIMIRNGNYYLSIEERINIAKKKNVNLLISIHTNSSNNPKISGLSTWILSKKRMNSEIHYLSKKNTKKIKLFKKNKKYFLKKNTKPYLKSIMLDLQFNHIQKSGYLLAKKIIKELKKTHSVYESHPKRASFGILKSPNFPSILIETGFISNTSEEKKLNSETYQKKIVDSIYLGLTKYFFKIPCKLKK